MQKKLTITVDQEGYERPYKTVGPRKISKFIEELVRPHATRLDPEPEYAKKWPKTRIGRKRPWNGPKTFSRTLLVKRREIWLVNFEPAGGGEVKKIVLRPL
jgi:hypothetical protein